MSCRLLAFTAALALFATPAAADKPQRWNQSFAVGGRPTVTITTDDGRIRVHTGPAGKVDADVRYEAHFWGWTSPKNKPTVDLHQAGNTITVTAKEPSVFMVVGGVSIQLDIDVTVPADCDLEIQSGDGSVKIEQPVTGRLAVHTGDGAIRVRGASGDVRLSTTDGRVIADSLDGSVAVRTGDGHVDLEGRFDRLAVQTGDGHANIDAVRGSQLLDGWNLETRDGPLTLRIPKNLKAELDAHTGDGRLHFDLPVSIGGRLDSHEMRGLINGGGPVLRLRTGDGSLTLGVSE